MRLRVGFSTQIMLILISLCVLCIGLLGITSYTLTNKLNTSLVMVNLKNLTDANYNQIDSAIRVSIRNHLRAIAEDNRMIMAMYHERVVQGELSEAVAKQEVSRIFLSQKIGATGYVYAVDSRGTLQIHPLLTGSNLAHYSFIQRQITDKNGYIEYSWQNPNDQQPRDKALYMTYFEPWDAIISASSYKDEFTSLVNVSDFKSNITSITLGQSGYMYVMNSRGELIIHPAMEGQSIYDSVDSQGNYFIREIINNKNGSIIYPWRNPGEPANRDKIVLYKYYQPMDWYLCSGVYLDELVKPLEMLKWRIGVLALLILIAAVMISLAYSRIILRPIHELIKATEGLMDGRFNIRLQVKRNDEIGRLTGIFNQMVARINRFMTDLNTTNQELEAINLTLEEKVRERTRQLEELSQRDGLTGIANRRRMDEYLQHEWDLATRTGLPLSLILIDIDYFKNFNDHYGHPAGDDCLRTVARTLSASLHRSADFAARYGGEEFMAILSDTDEKAAKAVAERIRFEIEQLSLTHEASAISDRLTVSLGVATYENHQPESLKTLIDQADQALYSAKAKGRNRVVSYGDLPPHCS